MGQFALLDEEGQPFPVENLPGRRALQGEPESSVTLRFRNHETGEERWSIVRSSPVADAAGNVLYAVNVWQDATAQKRAEAAQRFLAEAGEALATSLDVEATLANITRLAVPRLADWCVVHLVREDGSVSQLAVAHADPDRVAWARRLQEQYPVDPDTDQGVVRVARTGLPEIFPQVTDEMLVAAARDPEHLAILRLVGFTSVMFVPMIARERSVGVITFVAAESRYRYDQRDLELKQELARRAALAIDNARLFDAERAARLQSEEAQVRFRGLFEGVPDAILVVDAEGHFIEANAAACRMLGYEPGCRAQPWDWSTFSPAQTRPRPRSRDSGSRESGAPRASSSVVTARMFRLRSGPGDSIFPPVRSGFPLCATSPLNSRPIRFGKKC